MATFEKSEFWQSEDKSIKVKKKKEIKIVHLSLNSEKKSCNSLTNSKSQMCDFKTVILNLKLAEKNSGIKMGI